MRPEISKIMNYIYIDLQDHITVKNYPKVKGMSTNLFFFNHNFLEDDMGIMTSKMNVREAEMIVRFTWYIIQQKQYSSESITILTLYSG
jgi:hypothetical protein